MDLCLRRIFFRDVLCRIQEVVGILILSAGVVSGQGFWDREVDLSYTQERLSDILTDMDQKYDLNYSYGKLPLERLISFSFRGPLHKGLKTFFQAQNILYKITGNRIALRLDTPLGKPLRGIVRDAGTKQPLIGASVSVAASDKPLGAISDLQGVFVLKGLKVGRYDLVFEYLGYEVRMVKQILITTGKEIFLEVDMKESGVDMTEIIVVSKYEPSNTLNDMTTNSARSFSVEETNRFAAAISDPARMALSFAGVTGNGDDLSNEIVIRGNSSRGLVWRLEGIEIPNPNHFSDLGASSGNISMLSASTLSNSDFYTGAFPAEFGNALSGVFDLQLRNGNSERREHAIKVGTLGLEASSEGYFTKKSSASYLINYRYSTIDLIDRLLPALPTQVSPFQDLSFKINFPLKRGNLSMFGLGGKNATSDGPLADTSNFQFPWQLQDFIVRQRMGVIGLVHHLKINNRSFLRTSISTSKWHYDDETTQLQPDQAFVPEIVDESLFRHRESIFNSLLNIKYSAQLSFRAGFNIRHKAHKYDYKSFADADNLISLLDSEGSAQLMDGFAQWKYAFKKDWILNAGINISYFLLNKTFGVDPRLGLRYQFRDNQTLSLATGLYSKPDHLSTYFIERKEIQGGITFPNLSLPMLKAFHVVGGYDLGMKENVRLKVEAYYQRLFDIPVGSNPETVFSILNTSNIFGVIFLNDMNGAALTPEGTGVNYGLEFTLERFFSKGLYYLATASLFDSKFTTFSGRTFPTRYATNFAGNVLGGKEWSVGIRKKNSIGVNAKMVLVGGRRTSPILLEASRQAQATQIDYDRYNSMHVPAYFRVDLGVNYRINMDRVTHTFAIDLQNLTNRRNSAGTFYDPLLMRRNTIKQNGLIPFLNYQINF